MLDCYATDDNVVTSTHIQCIFVGEFLNGTIKPITRSLFTNRFDTFHNPVWLWRLKVRHQQQKMESVSEQEKKTYQNVESNPVRRNARRASANYNKPLPSIKNVFGTDSESEGFSTDATEDEFVMEKKSKVVNTRVTLSEKKKKSESGRSRGRPPKSGIGRAEILSQHEGVVNELRGSDLERGLTLSSPLKRTRVPNASKLNPGKFINKSETISNCKQFKM